MSLKRKPIVVVFDKKEGNPKRKPQSPNSKDEDPDLFWRAFLEESERIRRSRSPSPPPREPDLSDICKNPFCSHKSAEEEQTPLIIPTITEITNIGHLIELGKSYHCKRFTQHNGINLRILCNLVAPLTELQKMIGLTNVKEHIIDQILFFVQGFHNSHKKCGDCLDCVYDLPCARNKTDMLHTVITGSPGVGKTQFGKILGKIYTEMGVLSRGSCTIVKRSDLIAGYLGQTATKTQSVLDRCSGGVLILDEGYSLGNVEGRDMFSKECLDTITQRLSEDHDLLFIMMGYKDALEKCIFAHNEGLRRRFTFRYDLTSYTPDELKQIFELKAHEGGYQMCYDKQLGDSKDVELEKDKKNDKVSKLFIENESAFPNNGGDIETLFLKCKIAHSRTMIGRKSENKYVISIKDILKGLETFKKSRDYDNNIDKPPFGMYM